MLRPSVVANHLVSKRFENDSTNKFRKQELTTLARQERAEQLIQNLQLARAKSPRELERPILNILRDKGDLHLGNRKAIDALIATHSVIYNSAERVLFVSGGPAVAGPFYGFDLKASFKRKKPVPARNLPRDPLVTDEKFDLVRSSLKMVSAADKLIKKEKCIEADQMIEKIKITETSNYHRVKGDFLAYCTRNLPEANEHWMSALKLEPAYRREAEGIHERLRKRDL
jgi:hypothetical protein